MARFCRQVEPNIQVIKKYHLNCAVICIMTRLWRFLARNGGGYPEGGVCKATTPGVKQSCASQWRSRASRHVYASVYMIHCNYAYTRCWYFQQPTPYMFMVIGGSTQIVLIATNHAFSVNRPHCFTWLLTVPRALGPFTTGCVKLKISPLRQDTWRHNGCINKRRSISWTFWTYFVV